MAKKPYTVPFLQCDDKFYLDHFSDEDVLEYVIRHFNSFSIEFQTKFKEEISKKKIKED